jgi:DMSO/TMAO reductase YedYZ molybdopterin-dependent catalytic subunit
MPGQVPDVAALVPGRNGAGVMLAELLKVARACPGDDVVLVASDGMTSAPTRVADIGAAVLLHSLDGGPVPADQGGPFRVLAPKGQSACASVKGVVRVVVSARQE